MYEQVFEKCHIINNLLISEKDNEARNELIKLLDFHNTNEIEYNPLVNHLIRETGLFPYLEPETSNWEERFIYNAFKVDVGEKEPLTLHREQSFLLKELLAGKNIAVSAPTSFGKSFVIDAYIKLKKPKNVLIIVPTIALTDETRRRLYKKFAKEYKIITTSDVELAEKNIFIFPQERALNYVNTVDSFDIMIIDEFYKAGYKFDKTRSPSLVRAMLKLGELAKQKYYLAPNIQSIDDNPLTEDMIFHRLEFNTVFLEKTDTYKSIEKNNNEQKSIALLEILELKQTKSLIYAGTYSNIERLSILFSTSYDEKDNNLLKIFSEWLGKNYDFTWSLTKLVKRGIGIHNGRLHRSLSQIQVKLFEEKNGLTNLISTSSIIEGVNTSAENVILWSNKKGRPKLDDFTYKNIIGRSGRMFKHFIGKIYILEEPPEEELTQLDLPFPEEMIGDLDKDKYEGILTNEQLAKLKLYQTEMGELLGVQVYEKMRSESLFQSSNSELLKNIAKDLTTNSSEWNGLNYLNDFKPQEWDRLIYKIIDLQSGIWETRSKTFVEFIKVIAHNWRKSIPELLKELEQHDVGLNEFFMLERNITFKFTSLLKDLNLLQKVLLKDKNYDITRFITLCSQAFLPKVVFQLEEYGMPRMITKKIQKSNVINFLEKELTIHRVIERFNEIGMNKIIEQTENLDDFDRYIIDHFYEGIKTSD